MHACGVNIHEQCGRLLINGIGGDWRKDRLMHEKRRREGVRLGF
jgi:hypothetical protein